MVIESFWPDFQVDVVTPVAILRTQAGYLEQKAQGLLRAEVTQEQQEGDIVYNLDIVAPGAHGYRLRLLRVLHAAEMPYPVRLEYQPSFAVWDFRIGEDQDAFLTGLKGALALPTTKGIIEALIARVNTDRDLVRKAS